MVFGSVLLACRKGETSAPGSSRAATAADSARGDALFLTTAPAYVPEELEADLDAMGIKRIYVAGASLSATGRITPFPPPPSPIKKPVFFVLMGDPGAEAQIAGSTGELLGEAWAAGLKKPLAEAKSWATVVGVHVHLVPNAGQAEILGAALKALKRALGGLAVSVTLPSDAPAASWKPLSGAVDDALVFSFGRRPETNDRMVAELSEANAKSFPVSFRLLVVPGGYGRAGRNDEYTGRRLPDGEVDPLSEDKDLDFDFGQILSFEPGNFYKFKPRPGSERKQTPLSGDGGYAKFQVLTLPDLVRLLSDAGHWAGAPLMGRVFALDGLPRDGHLIGFGAIRALLTGKPVEPKLQVEAKAEGTGHGFAEFSLKVSNVGVGPTELSHVNNWIQIRSEGGMIAAVRPGDFDRYDLLSGPAEGARMAPFGRAVVCRLFENFFAPEEVNQAGPIRISGTRPKVFVSYRLTRPDGKTIDGPEVEVVLKEQAPSPTPAKAGKPAPKKLGRR